MKKHQFHFFCWGVTCIVVNKEIKGDDKAEDNIGDFNSEPSAADIQAIDYRFQRS